MKPSVAVVIVGEVDHGKSSLVGRLLDETGAISASRIATVKRICESQGKEFEHAFLLDAFDEEQRQGITIDVSHFQFATEHRNFHLIDAPGHREFLKNMISGSTAADAAIVLVDAHLGLQEQSRRHCYLLRMLGIRNVIVAINKMDLVDYSEKVFSSICQEHEKYLAQLGITGAKYVPVSAKYGVGFVKSDSHIGWYTGPTLIDALNSLPGRESHSNGELRFSVQDVYKFDERRIVAGRVESGRLEVGAELKIWPSNKTVRVASIERWKAPARPYADNGESIGITFDEPAFTERGNILTQANQSISISRSIDVSLFWMGKKPLTLQSRIKLKLLCQEYDCQVVKIQRIVDTTSLSAASSQLQQVDRHDAAELTLRISGPLLADAFEASPVSGRFVLIDGYEVSGGGIILKTHPVASETAPISSNIQRVSSDIDSTMRFERNGHRGAVVWFTGLSGSGKTTIAKLVENELFRRGCQVFVVDGDNLRHGLNRDLGFTDEGRQENVRRAGEVAKLFAESGQIVIASFVSPFESDRDRVRHIAGKELFFEVFIRCSLEACEKRDPKGLYRKARDGKLQNFTGITSPFDEPVHPDLIIDTETSLAEDCAKKLIEFLTDNGVFAK